MISIEREDRPWGRYFILHDEPNYKLKRIGDRSRPKTILSISS